MKCWFRIGFSIDDLTKDEAAMLHDSVTKDDDSVAREWFLDNIFTGRLKPNGDTYAPDVCDDNEIAFPEGFEIYL